VKRALALACVTLVLVVVEALCRRALADAAIVSALLSPGPHSGPLLLLGAFGYLLLRLAVVIALPALAGAALTIVVISGISARTRAFVRAGELSSRGPDDPGGRNVQEP